MMLPSRSSNVPGAVLTSLLLLVGATGLPGCDDSSAAPPEEEKEPSQNDGVPGQLFIIGGGSRTEGMIARMVEEAGLENGAGYGVILPMASSEPEAATEAARKPFVEQGVEHVHGLNFSDDTAPSEARLDSLRGADLVYIAGGDQRRFMEVVRDSPIEQALRDSYFNDHLIAGTSAGAAVMSEKMITGGEKKHSEYHETFRTLEAENIITTSGLGFLEKSIVDQHFLYRIRYSIGEVWRGLQELVHSCAGYDTWTPPRLGERFNALNWNIKRERRVFNTVQHIAHKHRVYPTKKQRQFLAQTFGCARYVWNWALEKRTNAYHEEGESLGFSAMCRRLTCLKKDDDKEWLKDPSSVVLQQSLRNQEQALTNFFEGRAQYPNFKRKHGKQTARHTKAAFSYDGESRTLSLAKMPGNLEVNWSRRLRGEPTAVTISKDPAGRYHVSIEFKAPTEDLPKTGESDQRRQLG